MKFRFVHAADLHLDTPFQGLSKVNQRIGTALQEASLNAFDQLVQLTIDRDASFLLLAGDIYEGIQRGLRAQFRFFKGLQELSDRNIKTFIVHGNHDPLSGWSAIREWPAHVKIFGSDKVEDSRVEIDGKNVATIYGISYPERVVKENLSRRYQRKHDDGIHIGLLHCNLNNTNDHSPYAPCSEDDLCEQGFDYWALGHIHRQKQWKAKDTWIAYSGNTQGRSPKYSETGSKGALVVECEGDAIYGAPEFVPVDTIRFCDLPFNIGASNDLPTLKEQLLDAADSLASKNQNRSLLVRTTLQGRSSLTTDLQRSGTLETLRAEMNEATTDSTKFIWWERINNQSRSPINRDTLKNRGDFTSELVSLVDNYREDPITLQRFMKKYLSVLKSSDLDQRLDDITNTDEIMKMLLDAEALAIETLEVKEDN